MDRSCIKPIFACFILFGGLPFSGADFQEALCEKEHKISNIEDKVIKFYNKLSNELLLKVKKFCKHTLSAKDFIKKSL